MRLLTRNPLAFPTGYKPGFDPTHVAAPKCKISVVAASGGTFTEIFGTSPGISGTRAGGTLPTYSVKDIGPSTYISATTGDDRIIFSGQDSTITTTGTFACICRFRTDTGSSMVVVADYDSNASQGMALRRNTSTLVLSLICAGGTTINSTVSVSTGVPYFILASNGPVNSYYVAKNLASGSVLSDFTQGRAISAGAPNGSYLIGNTGINRPCDADIAAAMFSTAFISKEQLLQWAAEPWSFWYPNKI